MNEYNVTISYIAHKTITVLADDADEAVNKVYESDSCFEDAISYVVETENGIVTDGMF